MKTLILKPVTFANVILLKPLISPSFIFWLLEPNLKATTHA